MLTEEKEKEIGVDKDESKKKFALQWHITAKCSNSCEHCYLQETEKKRAEIRNELSLRECFEIINDFKKTTKAWDVDGRIYFTGGDPLLKKGFFKLVEYAREKGMEVGILGNPNLLDSQTALMLKEMGVFYYQVSIEGMKETHDRIRGEGSFEETLRAIEALNEAGISSNVMFTVSRENMDELIPTIKLVSKMEVSAFDFARLVPIGKGKQYKDDLIKPLEYRNLLINVLEEYKRQRRKGSKTFFGRKDHLWKLLYQELGLSFLPSREDRMLLSGCQMGIAGLTVVSDGTVYACRRLPIEVGKVPKEKIRNIFIDSENLNNLRDVEKMEKCSRCYLFSYCRGCPAVAYGLTGSYFSPDPQCWKEIEKEV